MAAEDEFAREIAKQLPVREAYTDIAKPAARQAGQLAEDLVKVIQLALAPVQVLGALQDRFRAFVDRSVRRVPEDQRISPAPQIVGPILEGVRYETEGTPVDEMFSQLLSRACDVDRISEAHPAYPILIRQLAPDEARMIVQTRRERVNVAYKQSIDRAKNYASALELKSHGFNDLDYNRNVQMYLVHLKQVGLLAEETMRLHMEGDVQHVFIEVVLTEFGKHFARAVLP